MPLDHRHLVHSSGDAQPGGASSLWSTSSWFAAPPAACPNSRPREELPTAAPGGDDAAPDKACFSHSRQRDLDHLGLLSQI